MVLAFKHLLCIFLLSLLLVSSLNAQSDDDAITISDKFSEKEKEQLKKESESHGFQAEVSRLMDIIINSFYENKDVFLRELISNAADALEKVRFLSISDPSVLKNNPNLEVRIEIDKDANTLTLLDSGVGMTKDDLVNNLGTVARSGTTNFLEAIAQGADVNLVGQFGVGFYSAFLVADKVTVISKNDADDTQHVWESSADAKFTVAVDPRGNTLKRGTKIILHLKEDSTEYLNVEKVKSVVQKFNQFVNFPIFLRTEKTVEEDIPDNNNNDDEIIEEEESTTTRKEKKTVFEWERINPLKPIWMRSKEDLNETDYIAFYKSIAKDSYDPLSWIHFSAEGEVEFKSILYIPSHEAHNAWNSYFAAKQDAIKLYARRVLVADEVYELLPKWLNFIKGVVDSDDLPLKVDRGSLSQDRMMKVISKKLVGKFLEMVKQLAKDDSKEREDYQRQVAEGQTPEATLDTKFMKFWKRFNKNLRVGCVEDDQSRDKLVKVFRYHTSKTGVEDSITLDEYVDRLGNDQKSIFYITNENYDTAMSSPHIQIYKKKNLEVLILTDPLDEPCFQRLMMYQKRPIVSIEKINSKIDFSEDEKTRFKRVKKAFKPLVDFLSTHLKSKVSRVQLSQKLVDDPAVITAEAYGPSAYSEKILKAQTFSDYTNTYSHRILEINPGHPFIRKLLDMTKESPDDPEFEGLCDLLYDTTLLHSGFTIDNPHHIVRHLVDLLKTKAKVPADAVVEEYELSGDESADEDTSRKDEDDEEQPMPDFDEAQIEQLMRDLPKNQEEESQHVVTSPIHDEL